MVEILERPVTPLPPEPPRRRLRWLRWVLGGVLLVVVVGATLFWLGTRPPRPVSVSDVVGRFRSAQPTEPASALRSAPATGVYVYATKGGEHISVGDVTHTYPARTTLTVTRAGCGLQLRWDALEGRYMQWQLCSVAAGWGLHAFADVHKFLYMTDEHRYRCAGDPVALPRVVPSRSWTVACAVEGGGKMTQTVTAMGTESRLVAGRMVRTLRLAVVQHATGASVNNGTVEAWVLPATGLPVSVVVRNHGSQTVLGSHVTYDESARYDLTSLRPRR